MPICIQPIKDCKHPEWTYGEICVRCNECGRFDYGGVSNPVRSDIEIVSQYNPGIPPIWEYPKEEMTYFEAKWQWRSLKGKYSTSQQRGELTEVLPPAWYPERLDHVRWWIEGRNY